MPSRKSHTLIIMAQTTKGATRTVTIHTPCSPYKLSVEEIAELTGLDASGINSWQIMPVQRSWASSSKGTSTIVAFKAPAAKPPEGYTE